MPGAEPDLDGGVAVITVDDPELRDAVRLVRGAHGPSCCGGDTRQGDALGSGVPLGSMQRRFHADPGGEGRPWAP
jgi:hypothetical protein